MLAAARRVHRGGDLRRSRLTITQPPAVEVRPRKLPRLVPVMQLPASVNTPQPTARTALHPKAIHQHHPAT